MRPVASTFFPRIYLLRVAKWDVLLIGKVRFISKSPAR